MGWIRTEFFENRSARLVIDRRTAMEIGLERAIEDEPELWAMVAYSFLKVVDDFKWINAVIFGLRMNVERGLQWEIFIHDISLDPVPEGVMLPEIDIKLTKDQVREVKRVIGLAAQMV